MPLFPAPGFLLEAFLAPDLLFFPASSLRLGCWHRDQKRLRHSGRLTGQAPVSPPRLSREMSDGD